MKILSLCLGLYDFWHTYEGEYINESLMARPDVELKVWGRDRIGYIPGFNVIDVIKHLYGNNFPDAIVVHSSMEKHEDVNDRKLFEKMETLHDCTKLVWRTFDCFGKKMNFYLNQIKKYRPFLVLSWYIDHVEELNKQVGKISKICWFPHSIGRRYFNKNASRQYDLALIGRCDNFTPSHFCGLNVYVPPNRKSRPEKGQSLISDLNLCKFSWNSPLEGKYATLRFVEAPACGTVSILPKIFDQLKLYFPEDTYIIAKDPMQACKIIKSMSVEDYLSIQQRAYKVVINNHSTDIRVNYLIDLLNNKNVKATDYFKI